MTVFLGEDVKAELTIKARIRAGITSFRAARGGDSLRGGIIDVVTWRGASAHEGVVEPDPVPALVSRGASQVEAGQGAAREGRK